VVWARGTDIITKMAAKAGREHKPGDHAKLFARGIDTDDIAQGQLGDCWLLSAIACLAEFPGAIEKVFITREYSARGKYAVQLYSGKKINSGTDNERDEGWVTIVVDDLFPCGNQSGEPIFAQTGEKSDALWVLILEKAFAKFCGSYCGLDGGHPVWALQAMTGDHVRRYMAKEGGSSWQGYDICHKEDAEHPRRSVCVVVCVCVGGCGCVSTSLTLPLPHSLPPSLLPRRMGIRKMRGPKNGGKSSGTTSKDSSTPDADRFFDVIREYDERKSVIAAGSMQGELTAPTVCRLIQIHTSTPSVSIDPDPYIH
jgi:hypothetical protein